ncbi:MAG: NAD(P)-dependent oxidoreductase [Trueperaceae bacterium]
MLALFLACTNRLLEADTDFRKGDWRQRYANPRRYANPHSRYLAGKTCLLLGYGVIGKKLTPVLQALNMNVSVLKRSQSNEENLTVYTTTQLHEALANADVVLCSLPETPETVNLLDRAAFAAMKPGSILVNVGRGKVIDQYGLYEALKRNHLLAAGIDVWWNYPGDEEARAQTFPSDAPLCELPNIIMSPHRADQVIDEEQARLEDITKPLKQL